VNIDNPYLDDESDRKAAKEMDDIVKTVFSPIYPMMAKQIASQTGIAKGVCVDLGSGPAALSISLAKATDLKVYALDPSPYSYEIAIRNIEGQGLSKRIVPVIGSVEDIPFSNDFADLIVSRAAIFFWLDLPRAFEEICRILKPGGKTHIGGGFGSAALKKAILKEMTQRNPRFEKTVKSRMGPDNIARIKAALRNARIPEYDITEDETGFWIHLHAK